MNERIKELWENCDDIQTVYPRQGSPIYASPELLEKFAALIVRECADICTARKLTPAEFVASELREYFGVSK